MVRKTVTVVFADVTGSTQMGEQLDPEALRRVMTRYFEVSRTALERHGGTVEKFIGDAVMAVFGVPAVHEDDALRAARAALELRHGVAELGLEVRIGVNSGEVVTEDGETLVTGDAVNVAARLEQAASPGEILVGDATYRLAREALRVAPVEPVVAKGKADPVIAWRLVEVLDDTPAFTRRIDAPFVGRRDELARLHAVFERVMQSGGAQLATVLGVPGIGKSRLARELVQRVHGDARVVVGRCLAYGEGITYWPLAEIVRSSAGADRDAIASVAGDDLAADWLGAAIGVGGAAATREEVQWAARLYLEALAAGRPLVVVLDDLHWAEQTFLDLVEYVADFATAPILLLCTARPDLLQGRPGWTMPRANSTLLVLEPLAAEDAAGLAGDVDEATRRRIVEVAEGNPLFVEQFTALWTDAEGELDVPPSLQALLAARLDSLSAGERSVLERASVEGRLFHRGAVVELVPEDVRPDVGGHLLALVRKEFLRPDRARLPGDDAYRFAHILIHDVAYDAMSKELQAELHDRFADWLTRDPAGRLGEQEEIVAYHLEQTARYRRDVGLADDTQAGRRAAELLVRSGTRAYDRGDLSAARHLLERSASLVPPGDPLRLRALPLLGAAIFDGGQGAEPALAVLEQAITEGSAAGDRSAEAGAWAMHRLVGLESGSGLDTEAVRREHHGRVGAIEGLRDARALVFLRRLELALALYDLVDLGGAAERLLGAARQAEDRANAFHALFFLCASTVLGPLPVPDALAIVRQRFRRLAEGPVEEAAVRHIDGLLTAMAGELDEGLELVRASRSTFAEFGVRLLAAGTARDEALISRYRGDPAALERSLRPAVDELRAAGETGTLSILLGELADALYELRRYEEADVATVASERITEPADVASQVVWRRVRAKLLARRGEGGAARTLGREAVERAAAAQILEPLADAWRDLAEVERLAGRPDDARAALEQAIATYERKGLVPMVARARGELAALDRGP